MDRWARRSAWAWPALAVGSVALAAVSLLLHTSLSYDPWAWIVWGREIPHLALSTRHGPTWKPIPVAMTTVFDLVPGAGPGLWLLAARACLLGSVIVAAGVARRLVGPGAAGWVAAGLAVVAVMGCEGFARVFIDGTSEGVFLLFAFTALERALAGRFRTAMVLGACAGLVRPEVWLLLAGGGVWVVRRDRRAAPLVIGLGLLTIVGWVVPEWLGSGDPLRAIHRSAAHDPGTYSVLAHPVRAVLRDTLHAPLLAVVPGFVAVAVLGSRTARLVLAAGLFLILVVIAGVAGGEAGTPRYLLPGAATLGIAGAVGWTLLGVRVIDMARHHGGGVSALRIALAAAVVAACVITLPARYAQARDEADASSDLALSAKGLAPVIRAAGGRGRILAACGRPTVRRFRTTLLAWDLNVRLDEINTLARPAGIVLQERQTSGWVPPVLPGRPLLARAGRWRVVRVPCGGAGP